MFEDNRELFREWLVVNKGISERVARDTLSRCRRIQNKASVSLDQAVESPEKYLKALRQIVMYAKSSTLSESSQHTLARTLIAALRKYCEFINPDDHQIFPSRYKF